MVQLFLVWGIGDKSGRWSFIVSVILTCLEVCGVEVCGPGGVCLFSVVMGEVKWGFGGF